MKMRTLLKDSLFLPWLFLIFLLLLVYIGEKRVSGDTGFQGATRVEVGSYNGTIVVTMSNSAATLIDSANVKRPDETCFNNSANTLWISSNTAGTTAIGMGFPVLSSSTFKLGSYTGSVYGTLNSGSGDVRCWQGLVQ